ncbi:MAG: xanthan lyase [Cytophagaceae bacterium SCN 52-12]|nr:MAG: xanthan lyase [Cytophagaceae bacterium SCN 52-12]
MKKKGIWGLLLILSCYTLFNCSSSRSADEYDIVIYGATSAGVIAAYTGKQMGKSVVVINPDEHIGGLTSGGLGQTDIGNKHAVTGISREFYRKLGKVYGTFEQWTFEPKEAEKLFREYLEKGDVPVIVNKRIARVEKNGSAIQSVTIVNTLGDPGAERTIKGKVFIDATYEGDLMPLAGVSYFVGREDNSVYNETLSGFQLPEYHKKSGYHQFPDGVSPYKVPGDPASGLLWGISEAGPSPTGAGDKLVQAYNFRICLTDSVENQVPITRPDNYDSTKYELLVRLIEAQPTMRAVNQYFIWSPMPKRKTDINNRGGFSTDMIGYSHSWAEASHEERKKIYEEHYDYTKGLLYFMKTDPRVPDTLRNYIANWGYPKDEYADNGHWTPQIYVREGRRLVGEYVMTERNCRSEEIVEDGVGMAAYTMDSHNTQRIVVNGMVKNEGNVEVGGGPPYPISYRALVPKRAECSNLLVPVGLSSSHIAFGSIRMEPVFMVLGQSAAVAAAMAIDAGAAVQDVDVKALQQELRENPLADGSPAEIVVDDNDAARVQVTGEWQPVKRGVYGPSALEAQAGSGGTVRFAPSPIEEGEYDVYVYFTMLPEVSDLTTVRVSDGSNVETHVIDKAAITIEGQTSGKWHRLTSVKIAKGAQPYVEYGTEGAKGRVIADAVIWKRAGK